MIKDTKKRKLFILLACNVMLMALLVIVGVSDATSDDYGSQMILFSEAGKLSPWSSALWTIPLYYLQRTIPIFAWIFLAQLIIIVISFNVYAAFIWKKFSGIIGDFLIVFLGVIVFQSLIQNFNFTQTASFGIGAGFLLMFCGTKIKSTKRRYGVYALAILLLVLSVQIRTDVMYIYVGCLVLTTCYSIFFKHRELAGGITAGCIALLLCFACAAIDNSIKTSDAEFAESFELHKELVSLIDYEIASYDDATIVYDNLGLSENDASMIRRKSVSDPAFFDMERVSALRNAVSYNWSLSYFFNNIIRLAGRAIKTLLVNELEYYCYGIIVLGFLLLQKRERILPVASILMIVSYLILFAFMGRLVERVVLGVVLLSTVPVLISLDDVITDIGLSMKFRKIFISIFIVMIILPLIGIGSLSNRRSELLQMDVQELADYIVDDEEHLYIYSKGLDQNYKAVNNLLFSKDYYSDKNTVYVNMPVTEPYEKIKLERYGVKNIYKDSVDSNVIRFIIDDDVEQIEKYINEHYCPEAEIVLDKVVANYTIYRVVSK